MERLAQAPPVAKQDVATEVVERSEAIHFVEHWLAFVLSEADLVRRHTAVADAWRAVGSPLWLATMLAERLKSEADRHWLIDARISWRLAETIIALGEESNQPQLIALGTMARADATRWLGDPLAALAELELAATLYRQCNDEVGWARTRIGTVGALLQLGQFDNALAVAADARPVLSTHGELLRLARLDFNTAFVHDRLGQSAAALERYAAVLSTCTALDTPEARDLQIITQVNRALVYKGLGNLPEALRLLEEARALSDTSAQIAHRAKVETNLGAVYMLQGRYGPALRALSDACAVFKELGLDVEAADAQRDMLDCYLAINRPDRVLIVGTDLSTVLEQRGLMLEYIEVNLHRARALVQLQRYTQSLEILDALQDRLDDPALHVWRVRCLLGRVEVLLAQPRPHAAEACALLTDILAPWSDSDMVVEKAQAVLLLARTLTYLGEHQAAHHTLADALHRAHILDVPWMIAPCYVASADLSLAQDDLEAAALALHQAIGALEKMQSHMTLEMRRSYFSTDHEKVYQAAMRVALRRHRHDDMFDLVERVKSRAIFDHIAGEINLQLRAHDEGSRPLIEEYEATLVDYQLVCAALSSRSHGPPTMLAGLSPDELAHRATACETRMHDLIEALHVRHPAYADDLALRNVRSINLRPSLQTGHLILSYYALPDDLLIVALDHSGTHVFHCPAIWRAICTDIRLLSLNIERVAAAVTIGGQALLPGLEANARGILYRLWQRLLAPVDHLLVGAERLTIVPYGPLHRVPFHALYDGQHYLAQQVAVSYAPSANMQAMVQRRATRRAQFSGSRSPISLVAGTTLHGQLPHVEQEAQQVSRALQEWGAQVTLTLDKAATRSTILNQMASVDIIHLATHGCLHPSDPLFSYLQVSDGRITTADIYDLNLTCPLVTLSACDTGRGHLGGGDDLAGLGQALLYAGADALALSLWPVADASACRFMEVFYAGLTAGQAKDEALRHAQTALLQELSPAGYITSHPYFWAAFILVGDQRPLPSMRPRVSEPEP